MVAAVLIKAVEGVKTPVGGGALPVAETQMPPGVKNIINIGYFHMKFSVEPSISVISMTSFKPFNLNWNFIHMCSPESDRRQVTIGLGSGLALNMCETTAWTNDDRMQLCALITKFIALPVIDGI